MVITHNNKTEIVSNLKDCYSLLENDNNKQVLEAAEDFINNGDGLILQEDYDNLEEEFKNYELSNESYISCLNEVLDIAGELNKYIEDAKKINRQTIFDYLEEIKTLICNEI